MENLLIFRLTSSISLILLVLIVPQAQNAPAPPAQSVPRLTFVDELKQLASIPNGECKYPPSDVLQNSSRSYSAVNKFCDYPDDNTTDAATKEHSAICGLLNKSVHTICSSKEDTKSPPVNFPPLYDTLVRSLKIDLTSTQIFCQHLNSSIPQHSELTAEEKLFFQINEQTSTSLCAKVCNGETDDKIKDTINPVCVLTFRAYQIMMDSKNSVSSKLNITGEEERAAGVAVKKNDKSDSTAALSMSPLSLTSLSKSNAVVENKSENISDQPIPIETGEPKPEVSEVNYVNDEPVVDSKNEAGVPSKPAELESPGDTNGARPKAQPLMSTPGNVGSLNNSLKQETSAVLPQNPKSSTKNLFSEGQELNGITRITSSDVIPPRPQQSLVYSGNPTTGGDEKTSTIEIRNENGNSSTPNGKINAKLSGTEINVEGKTDPSQTNSLIGKDETGHAILDNSSKEKTKSSKGEEITSTEPDTSIIIANAAESESKTNVKHSTTSVLMNPSNPAGRKDESSSSSTFGAKNPSSTSSQLQPESSPRTTQKENQISASKNVASPSPDAIPGNFPPPISDDGADYSNEVQPPTRVSVKDSGNLNVDGDSGGEVDEDDTPKEDIPGQVLDNSNSRKVTAYKDTKAPVDSSSQFKEASRTTLNEEYRANEEDDDVGFFNYFLSFMAICAIGFLLLHNKKRIIAMVVEGRRPRNSTRRRSSSSYRKLENNFD